MTYILPWLVQEASHSSHKMVIRIDNAAQLWCSQYCEQCRNDMFCCCRGRWVTSRFLCQTLQKTCTQGSEQHYHLWEHMQQLVVIGFGHSFAQHWVWLGLLLMLYVLNHGDPDEQHTHWCSEYLVSKQTYTVVNVQGTWTCFITMNIPDSVNTEYVLPILWSVLRADTQDLQK